LKPWDCGRRETRARGRCPRGTACTARTGSYGDRREENETRLKRAQLARVVPRARGHLSEVHLELLPRRALALELDVARPRRVGDLAQRALERLARLLLLKRLRVGGVARRRELSFLPPQRVQRALKLGALLRRAVRRLPVRRLERALLLLHRVPERARGRQLVLLRRERRGGVERRQLELKGAEDGY